MAKKDRQDRQARHARKQRGELLPHAHYRWPESPRTFLTISSPSCPTPRYSASSAGCLSQRISARRLSP